MEESEESVAMNEIKNITEKIKKFRDERDWLQFHRPAVRVQACFWDGMSYSRLWLPVEFLYIENYE